MKSLMKSALLALAVTTVGFGCAASTSEEAPLSSGETIPASTETTNRTGVAGWEVAKDGTSRYEVVGRGANGEIAVQISTRVDATVCTNGGATVTFTVAQRTLGVRTLGCNGETVSDTLVPESLVALDRLNADLDAKNAGKTPPPPMSVTAPIEPKLIVGGGGGGGTIPPACQVRTDTSCVGVVLFCNDHFFDCSTSGWHPCGVCFGVPW